jgi:hypothetical protein
LKNEDNTKEYMHFEIITMDDLFDVCRDFVVKRIY